MVYLPTITEQKSAGRVQRAGRGAGGVAVVYVQRLTHAWRHGASLHPVHCSAPVDASLSLQHWAPRRAVPAVYLTTHLATSLFVRR